MMGRYAFRAAVGGCLWALLLSGCGQGYTIAARSSEGGSNLTGAPIVCDPFGGGGGSGSNQGVQATLHYLPDGGATPYGSVAEFFAKSTQVPADLFFNQINVPTRAFSSGFPANDGSLLKRDDGSTLFEYFGLKIRGRIKLGESDAEGLRQFAVLSDDGSVLELSDGADQSESITVKHENGSPNTPTRLACGTHAVRMSRSKPMSLSLDYFQGPRYHIALILLWRKLDDSAPNLAEAQCDKYGNDYFFDSSTTPSTPQAAYQRLLADGWQPVPAANLFLPKDDHLNPCN